MRPDLPEWWADEARGLWSCHIILSLPPSPRAWRTPPEHSSHKLGPLWLSISALNMPSPTKPFLCEYLLDQPLVKFCLDFCNRLGILQVQSCFLLICFAPSSQNNLSERQLCPPTPYLKPKLLCIPYKELVSALLLRLRLPLISSPTE